MSQCRRNGNREIHYTFPSKLTRGLTGIVYGDDFLYSDKRGNVIAKCGDSGEKWGTLQQTLMIKTLMWISIWNQFLKGILYQEKMN